VSGAPTAGNVAESAAPGPAVLGAARCQCGSHSWQAYYVVPGQPLTTKFSEQATHERRICLSCNGYKGDPKRLSAREAPPAPVATNPLPASSGVVEVELVEVRRLVFDRELQMRTKTNDETIADYAEKMEAGQVFPAIRVIRVGEQLLVVDGWHRGLAAQKAKQTAIPASIQDGTRRDAILAAISANGDHGLQRTNEDKRRAVVKLLQDAEWCKRPARELGELAKVSHQHVNNLRKHYDVAPGVVLTEDRVAEVDGVLPERYEAIAKGSEWLRQLAGKVRAARSLKALAALAANTGYGESSKLITIRLEDLATDPWLWTVDRTAEQRLARTTALDNLDQIGRAILMRECPQREKLFAVWRLARSIERLMYSWDLTNAEEQLKGRPALLASVKARAAELKSKEDAQRLKDPSHVAEQLLNGPLPKLLQGIATAVEVPVLNTLVSRAAKLPNEARVALRRRLAEVELLVPCPDPSCEGFAVPRGACWACRNYPAQTKGVVEASLAHAGRLLLVGRAVRAGEVLVDRWALGVLSELDACLAVGSDELKQWIYEGPPDLRNQLLALVAARATVVEPPSAMAAEVDEDLDDDDDGEDEDLDGEDDDDDDDVDHG
jgi:ParB-like chromosome segregation protein Spo0J